MQGITPTFYRNFLRYRKMFGYGDRNTFRYGERSSDSRMGLFEKNKSFKTRLLTCKRLTSVALLVALVCTGAVMYIVLRSYLTTTKTELFVIEAPDPVTSPPPTPSILGEFGKAAVVSNGYPCAGIGKGILEKGGSAVDATIAVMLCDGVTCPQTMGLGGGFLMTIYERSTKTATTLNARETAPAAASKDMFNKDPNLSQIGGLSVAVPGELRGYQAAWERFGKLPWSELFEPTIQLCEEGIPVNQNLGRVIKEKEADIRRSKTLRSILQLEEGELPKYRDTFKMPLLAQTMRKVAYSPLKADELYNGSLTQAFVEDIRNAGGIITVQDMANYSVKWAPPAQAQLSGGLTLYSSPPPGSGLLLAFILRLLDGFVTKAKSDVEVVQRITETFKHAYGRRMDIGDPDFYDISQVINDLTSELYIEEIRSKISDTNTSQEPVFYGAHFNTIEDHGTSNIVVLAPNGDAVSVTSTVNLYFGSQLVSMSTGIILNDEMDDFSVPQFNNFFGIPPSPANFIAPGKRPLSSMCPSIIVDQKGDVRLVVGAAGGTKITTATALVTILNLWFDMNIKEAIDKARFHHQLMPMEFAYEYGIVKEVIDGIKQIGHVTHRMPISWRSCVTAIARNGSMIHGNSDNRRPGRTSGF